MQEQKMEDQKRWKNGKRRTKSAWPNVGGGGVKMQDRKMQELLGMRRTF